MWMMMILYGCVDETQSILKLRHNPDGHCVNQLKQGDVYKDYDVDIMDSNAKDYLRSLKITYIRQLLLWGCLARAILDIGSCELHSYMRIR